MRCVSSFVICCLLVNSAIAKEPEVTSFPVSGDDESKATEIAARLRRLQSRELFKQYVNGKDDSLALCARWSEILQEKDKERRIKSSQCSRFIGYVEGRLRISAPAGWQQWLHINFDKVRDEEKGRFDALMRIEREYASRISEESDEVTLFDPKDLAGTGVKVKLPTISRMTFGRNRSGIIDGPKVFVADHATDLKHFPLFCFALDKENPQWKADVWGAQLPMGRPGYLIEVTTDEERVFVFGGGSGFIFLEGFALDSGKPLVRFNTQVGE